MTKLRQKIVVWGDLAVLTGLHVGSAGAGMQIGSVDSPVVRDPISREPYIPGSSLKGGLRSLLETATEGIVPNRSGGGVSRHECDDYDQAIECPVCRLFGSTGNGRRDRNHPARLTVCDLPLTRESFEELSGIDTGLMYTEWKFENALDRITSAANPRQIERVPKGSAFEFRLIYDDREDAETLREDLQNLVRAMQLLQDDALGGHGSRGYGRVAFAEVSGSRRPIEDYGAGRGFHEEQFEDWVSGIPGLAEGARA